MQQIELLPPLPARSSSSTGSCHAPVLDRFLTLDDVKRITTLSKSSIYTGIAEKTFPRPVPIAERRVAWLASEIAAWQRQRVLAA